MNFSKMKKRISSAIILFILTSIIIVLVKAFNSNFTHSLPKLNSASSSANCRMVQHTMGETCVPNNPKHLVIISQFTLGNVLNFDVKPIGSTIFISADVSPDYLFPKYLGDKIAGINPVGSQLQPNLEKILLLKPDLIIGWAPVKTVYPLLSKIAPTVLGDWRGIQKSWQDHINFVAKVLGKEEAAQAAWNYYYQRIEKLKVALGTSYQDKEISVAYMGTDGIISYVKNSFDGFILKDAGLQRSKAQDINSPYGRIDNISEEKLEQIDGDVLFLMTGEVNKIKLLEEIQRKPLWKKLRAVKQNHVYFVDATTWLGGTLLAADAVIDDLFKYLVNIENLTG